MKNALSSELDLKNLRRRSNFIDAGDIWNVYDNVIDKNQHLQVLKA
jgi:hypothetical protein